MDKMTRFKAEMFKAGLIAVAYTGATSGCGPYNYMRTVPLSATPALRDAEAIGAADFAPYEYWSAVAYLQQAKTLMGYSEYERALDYGHRAHQLAHAAIARAIQSLGPLATSQFDPCVPLDRPAEGKFVSETEELQRETTNLAREIGCSARQGQELPPDFPSGEPLAERPRAVLIGVR